MVDSKDKKNALSDMIEPDDDISVSTFNTWGTKATAQTMTSKKLREIDALFEDLLPENKEEKDDDDGMTKFDDESQAESVDLPYAGIKSRISSDHDEGIGLSYIHNQGSTTTTATTSSSSTTNSSLNEYEREYLDPPSFHPQDDQPSSLNKEKQNSIGSHFLSQRRHRTQKDDSSISEDTIGVSSILDSMGLGPTSSSTLNPRGIRDNHQNKHFSSADNHNMTNDDNYQNEKQKRKSTDNGSFLSSFLNFEEPSSKSSKQPQKNHTTNIMPLENSEKLRHERQIYLRASVMMIIFLGILLFAVQFDTMAETKRVILKRKRRHQQFPALRAHALMHEEGVDRPGSEFVYSKNKPGPAANSRPTPIAKELAKVPKKEEGPPRLIDSSPAKQIVDDVKTQVDNKPPLTSPKESEQSIVAPSRKMSTKEQEHTDLLEPLLVKSGQVEPTLTQSQGTVQSMLPKEYRFLVDVAKPNPNHKDVPFFWVIPRSGGSFIKNTLSLCKGAVLASEAGIRQGHHADTELKVVDLFSQKYVNVDISNEQGIQRAKALGFTKSGLADILVTPDFHRGLSLLDENHQARAFTLLRHPIERAASTHSMLVLNGHNEVSKMSLEEYARSPFIENNWMVRFLSGKLTGEVTEEHFSIAKEILRTKFIVGLLEHKGGSLRRFEEYFGWDYTTDPEKQYQCRKAAVTGDAIKNESSKKLVTEGSQAWNLLMWQNKLDFKLYEYGKQLYTEQGKQLFPNLTAKKV